MEFDLVYDDEEAKYQDADVAPQKVCGTPRGRQRSPSVEKYQQEAPKEAIAGTHPLPMGLVRICRRVSVITGPNIGIVLVIHIVVVSVRSFLDALVILQKSHAINSKDDEN